MPSYGGWDPDQFPEGDPKAWKQLLEGQEERHALQAKSRCSREDIAKYASAFANSRGGVLVVGVETKGKADPIVAFPGIPETMTGQWLQDVVRGKVEPCPALGDYLVRSAPGDVDGDNIYAILIPESAGGPHQDLNTGVYWNMGVQGCVQMTDRQIRDAMGRGQKAELAVVLQPGGARVSPDGSLRVGVGFCLANAGRATARDVVVIVRVPGTVRINPTWPRDCHPAGRSVEIERTMEWRLPTPIPPELERSVGLALVTKPMDRWQTGRFDIGIAADTYADGVRPLHDRWKLIAEMWDTEDVVINVEPVTERDHALPVRLRFSWP